MKRKQGCHTKTNRETSHASDIVVITTKGERGDGGQEKENENSTSDILVQQIPSVKTHKCLKHHFNKKFLNPLKMKCVCFT
jgi:hypothetical protein